MAYAIFLNHSMTPADVPFLKSIADLLGMQGIKCYLAERDVQPGQPMSAKIQKAIRDCDAVYALLTYGGDASRNVQQEIGFAAGVGKPVVPIVEKGVSINGFKADVEWIEFDRKDPQSALLKLAPHAVKQAAAKDKMEAVALLILGAFIAWLIFSKS